MNQDFKLNLDSSLYHIKEQYNTFIEKISETGFKNLIKNSNFEYYFTSPLTVLYWTIHNVSFSKVNNILKVTFQNNDSFIQQNIVKELKPNQEYTLVLKCKPSKKILLHLISGTNILIHENNGSSITKQIEPSSDVQTILIKFKTNENLISSEPVTVRLESEYSNTDVLIYNIAVYPGSIDFTGEIESFENVLILEDNEWKLFDGNNLKEIALYDTEQFQNKVSGVLYQKIDELLNHSKCEGIDVYFDSSNKLNFKVHNFNINLSGDASGTGHVIRNSDVTINVKVNKLQGIPVSDFARRDLSNVDGETVYQKISEFIGEVLEKAVVSFRLQQGEERAFTNTWLFPNKNVDLSSSCITLLMFDTRNNSPTQGRYILADEEVYFSVSENGKEIRVKNDKTEEIALKLIIVG